MTAEKLIYTFYLTNPIFALKNQVFPDPLTNLLPDLEN